MRRAMTDDARERLSGKRLLVVEDEYVIASDLAYTIEAAGATVIGPAGTVEDALALLDSDRIDGAVLDVNLHQKRVYPVADALAARRIPFVFATGYDAADMPPAYAGVPRYEKPVNKDQLVRLFLASQSG